MSPKRPVSISNPQKVYFPSGFTKADMIRYYAAVSPVMLPHLKDRPITLIRFPEGVRGEKFYEKNAPHHTPSWVKTFAVPRRHHEGDVNYILIQNVETLAWCANLGAIELHPFLHRVPKIDRPTHIAFDLDPGEGADLLTCIEVAHLLRELFAKFELEAFPKVSGSKGLQLYVPLNTPATYDVTSPFAKSVAQWMTEQHPALVVSDMSKALRKKRVLIDWSQNSQSKTTVAAYSLRGKHDEPFVSAPVTWGELDQAARKKDRDLLFFSPDDVLARVKKHGDLFAPVLTKKQKLPKNFGRESFPTPAKSLVRYAAKRDFSKTKEPDASAAARTASPGERRFVIQKHAASHLHFDFRLEMGGTLKSWAVPKGLPYELGVKRSAFQVEDHPISYMRFEGTIPKGQYGGGTVMVWDIGTYELLGGNYGQGDLKLMLHGGKLKGEWHIFRIRSDENKPVWLIAKSGKPMKPLSARLEDSSVLTKRSMEEIASDNDAQWQSNRDGGSEDADAKPKANPAAPKFVSPMNPARAKQLPEGDGWEYEVKWDGIRAQLIKHGGQVRVLSAAGKSLAKKFPDIVDATAEVGAESCVIDGEIVTLDSDGHPAHRKTKGKTTVVFYAYDLLALNGASLLKQPLSDRREKLAELIGGTALRFSEPLKGTAERVTAAVEKLGLPGIVAKRTDSVYAPGKRSKAWQERTL